MPEFQDILTTIVVAVITAVVPILAKYACSALGALKDKLQVAAESEYVDKQLDHIFNLVNTAVIATTQTYVDALKKQGAFDATAQKVAFEMTKDTVLKLMKTDMIDTVLEMYGDFDTWLKSYIETLVAENKNLTA